MAKKMRWIHITDNDPEYFLFEERSDRFLSFDFICTEILHCNPEVLRAMIKEHLEESKVRIGLSSREVVRRKIWKEKDIMRTNLMRWAWSKYRIDKAALDYCLEWLIYRQEVEPRKVCTYNKYAWFYRWTGKAELIVNVMAEELNGTEGY